MTDIEIQIINPGDKLIIKMPTQTRPVMLHKFAEVADDFMKKNTLKALVVVAGCEVYVIKKGAQVKIEEEKK